MNRRRLYAAVLVVCSACLMLTAAVELAGRGSIASVVCTVPSAAGIWCGITGLRRLPGRGRHQRLPVPDDTVILPPIPPGRDVRPPGEAAGPGAPPLRPRPYVQPGDEDDTGKWRGFLP